MNERAGLIARLSVIYFWAMGAAEAAGRAAGPITVNLQYEAPPGCPDVARFKGLVIARLARDPFSVSLNCARLLKDTS